MGCDGAPNGFDVAGWCWPKEPSLAGCEGVAKGFDVAGCWLKGFAGWEKEENGAEVVAGAATEGALNGFDFCPKAEGCPKEPAGCEGAPKVGVPNGFDFWPSAVGCPNAPDGAEGAPNASWEAGWEAGWETG